MAWGFGTGRVQLCGKVLLPGGAPGIFVGIRLRAIRGVKGVVIGQLLGAILGVREPFELCSKSVLMEWRSAGRW